MNVCTGERVPASSPRNTRATAPGSEIGVGHIVSEVAVGVAIGIGQRDPQLHAVQNGVRLDRYLGMTNPRPRGHQIQLAGPDQGVHACTVAVLHFPTEQPAHRL